jgi:PBSX family phage terminase large subunit
VLAVEELVFVAVNRKDGNVAYIAPTYTQAREISWEMLKKRVSEIGGCKINETRLELTLPNKHGGESRIALKGWESIESLRGQAYDFLVLDEVAMYRNWLANWQEVIRPTLTDRKGSALFISTPKGFSFFYDLYNEEHKDKDYKSFHFTSYDNPHIPTDEIDKAKQELTEDRFAQEYLGDFRKTEGLVYKEFDRKRHLFSDMGTIHSVVRRLIGIDWGYTNPCAIMTIVEDGDRNLYVTQEYYRPKKTTLELSEYAASLHGNAYYPDPAEPDRCEELRRLHLNVVDVNKDVVSGIDSVRAALKNGKLFVHTSCVNLIQEFETYTYKERKPLSNEPEEPVKENDHALDAIRYVIHMAGPMAKTPSVHQHAPKFFSPLQRKVTHYAQ